MSSRGLENDLMILLSEAEQSVDLLKQPSVREQPLRALKILQDLVNSFANFRSDDTEGQIRLGRALDRQVSQIPESCLILRNGSGISLRSAMELWGHWADTPTDRRRTFRQIGRALVGVIRALLLSLLSLIDSKNRQSRWQDLCSIFVSDTEATIESISF